MIIADFDGRILTFRKSSDGREHEVQVHFDFCIGADGSYSSTRRHLMRYVRHVSSDFDTLFFSVQKGQVKRPTSEYISDTYFIGR